MKISHSGMGLPLDSSDSSRKLIHAVRHDRAQRDEILRGIVVYEVAGGRMCISDHATNKYLPNTMSAWHTEVKWDFKYFAQ